MDLRGIGSSYAASVWNLAPSHRTHSSESTAPANGPSTAPSSSQPAASERDWAGTIRNLVQAAVSVVRHVLSNLSSAFSPANRSPNGLPSTPGSEAAAPPVGQTPLDTAVEPVPTTAGKGPQGGPAIPAQAGGAAPVGQSGTTPGGPAEGRNEGAAGAPLNGTGPGKVGVPPGLERRKGQAGFEVETPAAAVNETPAAAVKETPENDVAVRAGLAIDALVREVLNASHADATDSFRHGLGNAAKELVDELVHFGIRGLSVADGPDGPQVLVDREAFDASLATLHGRGRAGRAIEDLVEGLRGRVADLMARRSFSESDLAPVITPAPAWGMQFLGAIRASTDTAPVTADGTPSASPLDLVDVRDQIRNQLAATAPVQREERVSGAQAHDREERLRHTTGDIQTLLDLFAQQN